MLTAAQRIGGTLSWASGIPPRPSCGGLYQAVSDNLWRLVLQSGFVTCRLAYSWGEDQRWTLAQAAALIARLFHVRYTLRGTSYLLHRMGFSPQVPVHRTAERDEGVGPPAA